MAGADHLLETATRSETKAPREILATAFPIVIHKSLRSPHTGNRLLF
jgi:hypothetical protein